MSRLACCLYHLLGAGFNKDTFFNNVLYQTKSRQNEKTISLGSVTRLILYHLVRQNRPPMFSELPGRIWLASNLIQGQHLPVLYNRQQQDEIHLRISPQFLFFGCLWAFLWVWITDIFRWAFYRFVIMMKSSRNNSWKSEFNHEHEKHSEFLGGIAYETKIVWQDHIWYITYGIYDMDMSHIHAKGNSDYCKFFDWKRKKMTR